MSKSTTVAVYVRVSGDDQNPEGQRAEIDRWLAGNVPEGMEVRWFTDKSTGDNLQRPGFEELQREVFNGEVGTIVVWRLDRLSRSLREGIDVLCGWCDKGIRVVSTSQQIDFNGALGKMLAAVLLGVAEMEQETRRERQAAGIAIAKQNKLYKGRKPGTTKGKPARAKQLRGKGLQIAEIAKSMNISISTVRRYLRETESV